jgi:hypothetical protein
MAQSKAWNSLKVLGNLAPWKSRSKRAEVLECSESELQEIRHKGSIVSANHGLFEVDERFEVKEMEETFEHHSSYSSFDRNESFSESEEGKRNESSRIYQSLKRFGYLQDQSNCNSESTLSSFCSRDLENDLSDADTMSAGQITPTVLPPNADGLKSVSGKPLCCWHVIEDTDTLSGICIRYGISEDALLRANRASRAALLARKSILIPLIENMEI